MTPKPKKLSGDPIPQSPKGMRDILGNNFYNYQGFFEKAAEIAIYYGFTPIETPILEQTTLFSHAEGETSDVISKEMYTLRTKSGDNLALRPELTPGLVRAYIQNGMQAEPQPVMLYSYGPGFRHDRPQRGRLRQFRQFELDVLGSPKAITDALVIKLTVLILEEVGITGLPLRINSVGDKDCRPVYRRELINYYKKHLKEVCADCRERIKNNPLRLLDCKDPKCQPIKEAAPTAVSFLCAGCKAHFKEVLEYLESMGINYEIDNSLVRGLDYYSRTVFEITESASSSPNQGKPPVTETGSDADETEVVPTVQSAPLTIAGGGRFDYLARMIGSKKDVPGVGASIGVDRLGLINGYKPVNSRLLKKPKVFFIQLGFDAKLKCFEVIEVLRKAKIPIAQTLARDSLATQLGIAEKMGVPYTMILGQKEALENSVIVRNMETRSQDTVRIDKLAEYLKQLH